MGQLTTHILDTARGTPAAGVRIDLSRRDPDDTLRLLKTVYSNYDGRTDRPLLDNAEFAVGRYALSFHVGNYFATCGLPLAQPPFIDVVPIYFALADTDSHYHVPLLVSPWGYTTYRGS
jgi:5-hydroxyisourate hydrolase